MEAEWWAVWRRVETHLEHLCQTGLDLRNMNVGEEGEGDDLIRTPKVPRLVFPPSRWTERAGAAADAGALTVAMGAPFVEDADDVAGTGAGAAICAEDAGSRQSMMEKNLRDVRQMRESGTERIAPCVGK